MQSSKQGTKLAALILVLTCLAALFVVEYPSNLPKLLHGNHFNETSLLQSLNETLTATLDARLSELVNETRESSISSKDVENVIYKSLDDILPKRPQCKYPWPIVYNKPHKTASTKIVTDIRTWAQGTGRRVFQCSGFIQKAVYSVRECVREESSGCAVVATHLVLDDMMQRVLEQKIGKFRTVTSTRNAHDRILSMYLQMRGITSRTGVNETDLKTYLGKLNPWDLYNYHSGEAKQGLCPLTFEEKADILRLANRYDIVICADYMEESNVILKARGLFQLSAVRQNVKGATRLDLSAEVEKMLADKSCVDEELHRHFKFRIAALYETSAGGKACLKGSRTPTTCLDKKYGPDR